MKSAYCFDTMIGKLLIADDGQGVTDLCLVDNQDILVKFKEHTWEKTKVIFHCYSELVEYFQGNRHVFTVQLKPKGTMFQKKVWDALLEIPYGETRSYKDIAKLIGNEKAVRAVGMANHYNPIMCMIPCHRVIGANGKLVGYASGLEIKKRLIELENRKDE